MGSQNFIKLSCDLCHWPAENFKSESGAKSKGWIEVGYEGYHIDRDFHSAWVCPSCVTKVVKAASKES